MSNNISQASDEVNILHEKRVVSIIDKDGNYIKPVVVFVTLKEDGSELYSPITEPLAIGEKIVNSIPKIRKDISSYGLIKPVWRKNSYWAEGASYSDIESWEELNSNSDTDKKNDIAILKKENLTLKAQLKAQAERSDFLEDCIAEMAVIVYCGK